MNKGELVKALSEHADITQKDAEKALSAFIEAVTETLKKGEEVAIIGFGAFSVVERSARIGMDFKTKKAIEIPASRGIKFKCGKNLKEAVN
jgi:nucleoid DNA-binding protein